MKAAKAIDSFSYNANFSSFQKNISDMYLLQKRQNDSSFDFICSVLVIGGIVLYSEINVQIRGRLNLYST